MSISYALLSIQPLLLLLLMIMLIGGFITMVFAIMLDIENYRLHIFLNAMLGSFIGIVMYLIIIMDYPFSSHFCIEPTGYLELLQWGRGG